MKTKILKKIQKRPFQLLEVMVAAFLILVCAAPALKTHIAIYREQFNLKRENERDHLVSGIHAKIVEKLYKNELLIEEILNKEKVFAFNDSTADTNGNLNHQLKKISYACTFQLTVKDQEIVETVPKYHLLELIITLHDTKSKIATKPLPYHYLVYISRQLNKEDVTPNEI